MDADGQRERVESMSTLDTFQFSSCTSDDDDAEKKSKQLTFCGQATSVGGGVCGDDPS